MVAELLLTAVFIEKPVESGMLCTPDSTDPFYTGTMIVPEPGTLHASPHW
jgi:hypothetical protein